MIQNKGVHVCVCVCVCVCIWGSVIPPHPKSAQLYWLVLAAISNINREEEGKGKISWKMRKIKPPFQVLSVQFSIAEFWEIVIHGMFYSFFFSFFFIQVFGRQLKQHKI